MIDRSERQASRMPGHLAMKAERPHTQVTGYRIPATLSERVHVPSNNKNLSGRGTARWEWRVTTEFKAAQIVGA